MEGIKAIANNVDNAELIFFDCVGVLAVKQGKK